MAPCLTDDLRQRFSFSAAGMIISSGGLCLDVSAPTPRGVGDLRLQSCLPGEGHNQTWRHGEGIRVGDAVPAEVWEFYVYRAMRGDTTYPLGDVNTANADGVLWYLQNEVVTEYTARMACPRKFGISEIRRFKVRIRQTSEMLQEGHHFGVRFAYDRGVCAGRCFPNNMCTCTGDCLDHFAKYGFGVGCNNFRDHYPFPDTDTPAPNGIWYSMPKAGRCDFPTGEHNCTWSAEHAGTVTLKELEQIEPGSDQCCDGVCTNFWTELYNPSRLSWRAARLMDVFAKKHPQWPRDLRHAVCDFKRWLWYPNDEYRRVDPWKEGCMREAHLDVPMYTNDTKK